MTDSLLLRWEGDVLTLTLNRQERRNAVDPELLEALATALRDDGTRARVVILRGAGDEAFSAGYDLARLTGTIDDLDADRHIGQAADALRDCPAPVIARLRGHCHGAGVELALSCDVRIAAGDLRMSVPAVSLGVVYRFPFVARLATMCGIGRAGDLLLAMPTLDAQEALAWGLVSEVVEAADLDSRIAEVAQRLVQAPRPAVEGTKASLRLLERRATAAEDAAAAQRLRMKAAGSEERREALRRRQDAVRRRPPRA